MEQCTTPSLFHKFEVSQGTRDHSLKNYGFQFGMPFSVFCTHAHLKSTWQQGEIIAELELQSLYNIWAWD